MRRVSTLLYKELTGRKWTAKISCLVRNVREQQDNGMGIQLSKNKKAICYIPLSLEMCYGIHDGLDEKHPSLKDATSFMRLTFMNVPCRSWNNTMYATMPSRSTEIPTLQPHGWVLQKPGINHPRRLKMWDTAQLIVLCNSRTRY